MTDVESPFFLDTNILVYANADIAPQHEASLACLRLLQQQSVTLWISRQVIREYIVQETRIQTYRPQPVPVASIIERVRYFQNHFRISDDNSQITENLLKLIQQVPVGGKQIHDANIVATMQANNINQILTLNGADFKRFSPSISVWSPQDVITRYTPSA